jgi:L-glutamine-phosphate cytidylyltransferase
MSSGLILAAGRGSRLEGLTIHRPKPLVEVGGMSLVERALYSLRQAGVADVHLVVGYKAEQFRFLGLPMIGNPEWSQTGIFWSLRTAVAVLREGPTIVSYGDIFFEAADVARLAAAPGDIVVAFDPAALALWSQRFADPLADLENFLVDENGRCTRIGGRLGRGNRLDGQFTGLFKLTGAGWATLSRLVDQLPHDQRRVIDVTSLLSLAITNGVIVETVPLLGIWGEVDQPSDIILYQRLYF